MLLYMISLERVTFVAFLFVGVLRRRDLLSSTLERHSIIFLCTVSIQNKYRIVLEVNTCFIFAPVPFFNYLTKNLDFALLKFH